MARLTEEQPAPEPARSRRDALQWMGAGLVTASALLASGDVFASTGGKPAN